MSHAEHHNAPATVTLQQAAALIGVSRWTLSRMKRAGTLPFPPAPGFANRYSRERVLAAINGHKVTRRHAA